MVELPARREAAGECDQPQSEFFRPELAQLVNPNHPLARLVAVMNWAQFDEVFSPLYVDAFGRPAIPTRLMVGLHYLKHLYQLSDEDVVQQWGENPYWQYLCGSRYFEHKLPIPATSMTRWRQKDAAGGADASPTEPSSQDCKPNDSAAELAPGPGRHNSTREKPWLTPPTENSTMIRGARWCGWRRRESSASVDI